MQSIAVDGKQSGAAGLGKQDVTTGAQAYLNVLCQFPNTAGLPVTPVSPAYVDGLMGAAAPGLGDFFAQTSFNKITLAGTQTTAWMMMPKPESAYPSIGSINGLSDADFTSLAQDCTGLIPPTVNMTPIKGINLLFNDLPGPFAYGGQGQQLTINNVSRLWSTTWMPPWGYSVQPGFVGGQTVLAHEMGHAFGLLHSAGPDGTVYKNAWDVMSDTYTYCSLPAATDPTYGCLGQDQIAFDKDFLGWIPAAQKFTYTGAGQTLTLGALADAATQNYYLVVIPHIGTTTQFTTIEFRRLLGYDQKLPGTAVIIHEVDTTRESPAWVQGTNGTTGAMFTAGMTYTAPNSGGAKVTVNAIAATTASLTISGTATTPSSGLQFFPLSQPVRLLDTRPGQTAVVAPGLPLTPNQPLLLPGQFSSGGVTIPTTAQALVGNATVDNSLGAPPGFAALYPSGSPLPLASNLNFVPGTVRPNAFTVALGPDGKFDLLSNTGGHFIVDLTGYYAPPAAGGLFFHPLSAPVRLLDTRRGQSAVRPPGTPLTAGQTLNLPGQFTSAASPSRRARRRWRATRRWTTAAMRRQASRPSSPAARACRRRAP